MQNSTPYEYNDYLSDSLDQLSEAVVGHKIVSVEVDEKTITLDNGKKVTLRGYGDCCAYAEVDAFLLHPEMVDHMIMGVTATDSYTTWHIYAAFGDILELTVGWSEGTGYYGYGITIEVEDIR